ncbi:protein kinase [Blautia schinkii]|nr:protein kinase [Blautia schinkii]
MDSYSQDFIKLYEQEMEKFSLPPRLQGHYQVKQCLKKKEDSWTVLGADTVTRELFVIKWGRGSQKELLRREFSIMKELAEQNVQGIPRPYDFIEEGEGAYFLREYAKGKTLYELSQDQENFSQKVIVDVGIQLCGIVRTLHSLKNSVIHKDIKPENVVMDGDGSIVLADFGTARHYREGQEGDTFVVGSPGTAAPEQYGIAQTDKRTDVYAIGRTLWYLAAGSYEEADLAAAHVRPRLKRIIRKAALFDPDHRYQTVSLLEKELKRLKSSRRRRNAGIAAFLMLLTALLTAAWYLGTLQEGRETGAVGKEDADKVWVFADKTIEQAVREKLWLVDGEPVTEKMLTNITSLRIVGDNILKDEDELAVRFYPYVNGQGTDGMEPGSISSLNDLSGMKNLERLSLCNQRIVDLTPLAGLPIKTLNLTGNRIQSVETLKELPLLEELYIGNNPLLNVTDLGECGQIKKLNLDSLTLQNLDFMENLELTSLSVLGTSVNKGNLFPLLTQKKLEMLCIGRFDEESMEILSQMDWLLTLNGWGSYELDSLKPLKGMDSLRSLAMSGWLKSLEGLGDFQDLLSLHLHGSAVTDITPIQEAPRLNWLDVRGLDIKDWSPLFRHPSLETVHCFEDQKSEILRENPTPDFEIIL